MKKKMSDAVIIETVIAIDVTFNALFDVLRQEQPDTASKLAEVLMRAVKKPDVSELQGVRQRIGVYLESLTRTTKPPTAH